VDLQSAISISRSTGWLSRQPIEFQKVMAAKARLKSVAKDAPLFHVEDQALEIYCLVEGAFVLSIVHPLSGLLTGHVFYPGQWLGEPAALGRRPRLTSIHARRPSYALAISRSATEEILHSNPAFNRCFFDLMASNAESYMMHAVDLMVRDPRTRLCARLLTLAGRTVHQLPASPASIPLSQDEVASTSCLSRKTVNALLGELVELGICELHYREIRILDVRALARIREGSLIPTE
jgi:CRP-like cAMP-binding protein